MIESMDASAALESVVDFWSPKVIGRVNDQYVKVVKLLGEFVWHKHDEEDELFQVIKGTLRIRFEAQPDVVLRQGEMCIVPRGMMHNPMAEEECWVMLIETVSTKHTGDVVSERTRTIEEQMT